LRVCLIDIRLILDLSDAVTSLASNSVGLLVGLHRGVLQKYDTESAIHVEGKKLHNGKIVSIAQEDDSILTFGQNGICSSHSLNGLDLEYVCYNDTSAPLISVAFHANIAFLLRGENEIIALNSSGFYPPLWKIQSTFALTCLAATESHIFAGTKSGRIFGWDNADQQASFEVTKQTAGINFLLADEDVLYSASDDNTIVQWSIGSSEVLNTLQRSSATALGHLGPVNSLSLCNNVLFSAGSDLTVRRWNVFNGKHEDLYFGHARKVNVVLCHNGSVFSGGDNFAVLLYKPTLPQAIVKKTTTLIGAATSKAQRNIKRVTARVDSAYSLPVSLIIIPSFAAGVVIIILLVLACWLRRKDSNVTTSPLDSMAKSGVTDSEATNTNTMLRTLVPTTMGLSMHAQLEINPVYISRGSLLAKGGGGYLYNAKLIGQGLIALHGENVVQKLVTVSGRSARESFDQEVAIMAMLSTFPHFCKLVGYTLNPLSMILKYYPSGSLDAWITRHTYGKRVALQLVYEISKAVFIMHSNFLAHCDLKTQNVLVESKDGDIHAYVTDFGITQVLSEKILAAKLFSVINLRGLSVRFASPEAFRAFKTKDYTKSDFKMYDIYSLACVMVELLTRKLPWS
jgi:serine/threonine protein kinase